MLIFKNNIYENPDTRHLQADSETSPLQSLNAFNFLKNTLEDDLEFFRLLEKSGEGILPEDLASFYPRSHLFGNAKILKTLLNYLQECLLDRNTWFRMNTYHFCLLYDSIIRHGYNYNHDNLQEQLRLYPELKGKPLQVDQLIGDLFFNTVFLIEKDKYDEMTAEDKKKFGFTCPCQFGVIHNMIPNDDEMQLKPEPGFPYAINV